MINFSLMTIYNKENVLNECLIKTLKKQDKITYEIKYINNQDNKYRSAKEGFLSEIDNLKGEYIVFLHQDIVFNNVDTLKKIYNYLREIEKFGIVGIAGVNNKIILSNITHGPDNIEVTKNKIFVPTKCETLDECLYIIKNEKKYIDEFKKMIGDGWHLYAVEYCIRMKLIGEDVYVIPSNIYHASSGASFDDSYYIQLKKISRHYKKNIKKINTTMGFWFTNNIKLNFQIFIRKLKVRIRKLVR